LSIAPGAASAKAVDERIWRHRPRAEPRDPTFSARDRAPSTAWTSVGEDPTPFRCREDL